LHCFDLKEFFSSHAIPPTEKSHLEISTLSLDATHFLVSGNKLFYLYKALQNPYKKPNFWLKKYAKGHKKVKES
jgi:hypothetical protein